MPFLRSAGLLPFRKRRPLAYALTILALTLSSLHSTAADDLQIRIDLAAQGKPVSPDLFGIFFEDLSFAADGELVGTGRVYLAPPDANMSLERGRVVIQPNTTGLGAGVYRGSITFSFSDGSIRTVTVALVIVPGTAIVLRATSPRENLCFATSIGP